MAVDKVPTIVSRSASCRVSPELEADQAKSRENGHSASSPAMSNRGVRYKQICVVRKAFELFYILIGNSICSGLIAVCLFCFSRQPDMSQWSKRAFNTLALLLSAAMGFGIGFLFDRIGMMARGRLLQSRCHSAKSIDYIMRGTLSSYALFFLHELGNCKHFRIHRTALIVLLYLISAFVGRFGAGFLGLAFNLDEQASHVPPLLRPDWATGVSRLRERSYSTSMQFDDAQTLIEAAQFFKSPFDSPNTLSLEISQFSRDSLKMDINAGTVIILYDFFDFVGGNKTQSGWQFQIQSTCRRYELVRNNTDENGYALRYPSHYYDLDGNIAAFEFSSFEADLQNKRLVPEYIWIRSVAHNTQHAIFGNVGEGEMWLMGISDRSIPVLFGCTVSSKAIRAEPQVTEGNELPNGERGQGNPGTFLGEEMQAAITFSPVWNIPLINAKNNTASEMCRRYHEEGAVFSYAVTHDDRTQSELWLSAFVANYIGNVMRYFNDILYRIKITPERPEIITTLTVNWKRLCAVLVALVMFQIICGSTALIFCKKSLDIGDDMAIITSMFADFPWVDDMKSDDGFEGRFIREKDGYRWDFIRERNIMHAIDSSSTVCV